MTGLTDVEFHCLFDCIEPFLSSLVHPDCKSSDLCSQKINTLTKLNIHDNFIMFSPPWNHGMNNKHKHVNPVKDVRCLVSILSLSL